MELFGKSKAQSFPEQTVRDLLELANRRPPDGEFLQFAFNYLRNNVPHRKIVIVLWLRDWKKQTYLLDQRFPEHGLAPDEILRDFELGDRHSNDADFDGLKAAGVALLSKSPRLQPLASGGGTPLDAGLFVLADLAGAPTSRRLLGFLQVWASASLSGEEERYLELLGDTLANNLYRSRSRRELALLRDVQRIAVDEALTRRTCLNRAVKILVEATNAENCVVFEHCAGGKLDFSAHHPENLTLPKDLTPSPTSILRRITERGTTYRLSNFENREEREQVIGTSEHDEHLASIMREFIPVQRAWLAAPIKPNGQVLAVVVLINKRKHLPKKFSVKDEEILETFCKYLGGHLPSLETMEVLDEITRTPLPHLNLSRNTQDEDSDLTTLFKFLKTIVPSTTGAWLLIKGEVQGEHIQKVLGGCEALDDWVAEKCLATAMDHEPEPGSKLRVKLIPGLSEKMALLVLRTEGPVGAQAGKLLRIFCAHLGQQLRALEIVEKQLKETVEVRHNIRAGLQGLSHLQLALNHFRVIRRAKWVCEEDDLRKLEKATKRAHLYAETTRVLMEDSLFMLSEISRENLKMQKASIRTIIHEVVLALEIAADEDYHVAIDVVNLIPRNDDQMDVDRGLIYITLFNLVENAIKYSIEREPVHVKLSTKENRWIAEISNKGPHLNEIDRVIIFRPFVRRFVAPHRKARAGTGLGLPAVERIVKAHLGEITVESELYDEAKKHANIKFTIKIPRRIS